MSGSGSFASVPRSVGAAEHERRVDLSTPVASSGADTDIDVVTKEFSVLWSHEYRSGLREDAHHFGVGRRGDIAGRNAQDRFDIPSEIHAECGSNDVDLTALENGRSARDELRCSDSSKLHVKWLILPAPCS